MYKTIAVLALGLALSTPHAHAAEQRSFYLNQWGGVNSCQLARTGADRRYCLGYSDAKRDPAAFNCGKADVVDEYRFCGKALPR